jgi:thioredoxin-related protein
MIKVSKWWLWVLLLIPAMPQLHAKPKRKGVQWMAPAAVESMMKQQPRLIVVDVYTSWCQYCKAMDATTWKNDSVVNYLAKNSYAVKLNAEEKNSQEWFGKMYEYLPRFKVHQLAVDLLRGNIVYPSTVIIPLEGEWQVLPGMLQPSDLEMVLKYYGSNQHNKIDFGSWQQQFVSTWQPVKK